jgi:hypothetical protein
MDHEEPALSLSDVVHDEPMDDDDLIPPVDENHSSPFPSSSITPLHEAYDDATHPSHHISTTEPFSVEMLEREIATLLNQNASAASAALINAAAQQRQANFEQENHLNENESIESIGGLGLNLTGLAAVLQAAHAQAAENERLSEALAAKDPVYARQREAALARQSVAPEKKTTRTAPAFHSLTAGEVAENDTARKTGEPKKGSDGSDYLYTDDGESDGDDRDENMIADRKRHTTPPIPRVRSPGIPSDHTASVPGEFNDISDILNHLSNHFDPGADPDEVPTQPSTRGSSPIVSHADQNTDQSQSRSLLVHSDLTPQPQSHPPPSSHASLASYAQQSGSGNSSSLTNKKSKKSKDSTEKQSKEKGPQSHVCEIVECSKSFSRKSDLGRHMRIHTGERPFVCDHSDCGKTFIQRSALQVHLRVHTGERPHSCEYPGCGKTFGDSSSLARHRRTHTGKRPYKCEDPDCEKTFTRRTTLTAHMRTHDSSWEPDPNIRYSYKSKRRKIGDDDDDDQELEESVRTITALFGQNRKARTPPDSGSSEEQPLEARVASISAEIAAALVQAQSRVYEDEDEDDEEDDEYGLEVDGPETTGPNTSGIRGDDGLRDGTRILEVDDDDDDDSDAFPVPLRTRKGKESFGLVGTKRKR